MKATLNIWFQIFYVIYIHFQRNVKDLWSFEDKIHFIANKLCNVLFNHKDIFYTKYCFIQLRESPRTWVLNRGSTDLSRGPWRESKSVFLNRRVVDPLSKYTNVFSILPHKDDLINIVKIYKNMPVFIILGSL